MTLYGSVSSLVLINAAGRYQYGGHHGQIAISGSYHIGHYITIIVLTCPDESALGTDDTGYGIIDQSVEIFNAKFLEFSLVLVIINLLENILKSMIVLFGNCIFSREPQILLRIYRIAEACSCKALDGFIGIVDTLNDPCSVEIMDQFTGLGAVCCGEYQLCLTGSGYFDLCIFIDITISMTGDGDGLGPVLYVGNDALYQDWCTEYGTV